MFLTHDNKLKIKWLEWGAITTIVLVLLGVMWFDKPLLVFLRHFDCNLWHVFGRVFDVVVWLVLTGGLLLLFFVKKAVDSGIKYKNVKNKFSVGTVVKDTLTKVRTNYAFLIFLSVLSASVVAKVLKFIIGRARPVFFETFGAQNLVPDFNMFSNLWEFNSMPSGHAVATFAGLVMVGMLAPKIKPFTWTLAIIVGLSRVCVGAHWPTDVLLGAFIGMVAADLVKYWAFRRK